MVPRVCQKPDNGYRAYQMHAMDGFLGRPLNPCIFLISQLPPSLLACVRPLFQRYRLLYC